MNLDYTDLNDLTKMSVNVVAENLKNLVILKPEQEPFKKAILQKYVLSSLEKNLDSDISDQYERILWMKNNPFDLYISTGETKVVEPDMPTLLKKAMSYISTVLTKNPEYDSKSIGDMYDNIHRFVEEESELEDEHFELMIYDTAIESHSPMPQPQILLNYISTHMKPIFNSYGIYGHVILFNIDSSMLAQIVLTNDGSGQILDNAYDEATSY